MESQYSDFIGYYTNVYPQGFCKSVIDEFERLKDQDYGINRQDSENVAKTMKQDFAINMNLHTLKSFATDNEEDNILHFYYNGLYNCISEYIKMYELVGVDKLATSDMKMQKTQPGEGYHIWHYEHSPLFPQRVLAFILYLNTLEEHQNGTTEFLYQQRQVRPIENTLLVWPAQFTHMHRGNPVYGNDSKYIVTGWVHYAV